MIYSVINLIYIFKNLFLFYSFHDRPLPQFSVSNSKLILFKNCFLTPEVPGIKRPISEGGLHLQVHVASFFARTNIIGPNFYG